MFSDQSLADSMYDGPMSMESNLDGLEDILTDHQTTEPHMSAQGSSNPIDKLYSMSTSYFNTD